MALSKYVHDLRTLPGDAAHAWRLGGAGAVWTEVAERTVRRAWRTARMIVFAQDLARSRRTPVPPGVAIRQLGGGEWRVLEPIATRRSLAGFRRRLEAGRVCLVAERDGRVLGYTWISERVDPAIETLPRELPPSAAYLWDLYVLPPERNGGVGSALVSARLDFAARLGYAEGWRMVAPRNHASLRTVAKTAGTGTRVVGEVRYVKVGPRLMYRFRAAGA